MWPGYSEMFPTEQSNLNDESIKMITDVYRYENSVHICISQYYYDVYAYS